MKKLLNGLMGMMMIISMCGCSSETAEKETGSENVYKIGICNYVDDASLNQIIENIKDELSVIEKDNNVTFEIEEDNCNGDASVLNQIVANFIADDVDLMIGVATPVALVMQGATEDNSIPVVFAAVSDPVGVSLVDSLDAPGSNITGTSDYLDTDAIMDLMFMVDPDADKIALLYDAGQDSSTSAISAAKAYLDNKGIAYKEYNGTNTTEVISAVSTIINDECDAVFTPSDNTIMTAELSIYEALAEAGIPHYAGADSFALNGAFAGYGVDYANLGKKTADMVKDILIDGSDVSKVAVKTFDNGIATINTETCEALGLNIDEITTKIAPLCTSVETIETADSFE